MKKFRIALSTVIAALFVFVAVGHTQTSITITNFSFESNKLGPLGSGGVVTNCPGWNGQIFGYTTQMGAALTGIDGTNSINLNGYIYQTNVATFVAGQYYTVSVKIGRQTSAPADTGTILLGFYNTANTGFLGNGTKLVTNTPSGYVDTYTYTYVAAAGDAGNPVTVAIKDGYDGGNGYRIDNVALSVAPAPLIPNGSFEAISAGGYIGGGQLSNWVNTSLSGFNSGTGGAYGYSYGNPPVYNIKGSRAVYIGGGIYQTLQTNFVAGNTYTLTIDMGQNINPTQTGNAPVKYGFVNTNTGAWLGNGTQVITNTPVGKLQTYTYSYTATTNDDGKPITIGLNDYSAGTAAESYLIDNVNLTIIPGPLVKNGSFEISSGYLGSAVPYWVGTGFTGTSNNFPQAFSTVVAGSGMTNLTGNNAINISGGIYQTVPSNFVAGLTYTLSIDMGQTATNNTGNAGVNYGFLNTNSGVMTARFQKITNTPVGTLQTYTYSYTATTNDAGQPVTVALDDFYATGAPGYLIDNVVLTINKTTPTLYLVNPTNAYNGSPQSATVNSLVSGTVSGVLYNGSATVPTAVGTYAITANFTPTDPTVYNSLTNASAGNFVIQNSTPVVTLTSPAAGSFAAYATVSLAATVVSNGTSITSVDFLANGSTVATVLAAPYTASWSLVAPGSYNITARANYAATNAVSNTNSITVNAVVNPTFGAINNTGSGFSFTLTGTNGQPYTILSSTNVAAPTVNWLTNSTGVFGVSGVVSYTNAPPLAAQQFFRIRTP